MAERIESIWDRVGRGDCLMYVSERLVSDVVRELNKSHDEMPNPERSRCRNLGKWYREKKSEMSTFDLPVLCDMNDSMRFNRVSSPLVMMEEMMELRSSALAPLR